MTFRANEVLATDDCYARLGPGGVGRIAYNDGQGPVALPVNFAVIDGDILFRIQPGSALAGEIEQMVGFQVDRIDMDDRSGWSVLLRGTARSVPLALVPDLIRRVGHQFPKPWAEGVHNVWIRISVTSISGRRLSDLTPDLVF